MRKLSLENLEGESHVPVVSCALNRLERCFPGFIESISGMKVLDFGCGQGLQAVAMAAFAREVVGIDKNPDGFSKAQAFARLNGLEGKLRFDIDLEGGGDGTFDVVVSQDCMEHYSDPAGVLREMASILSEKGKIFITFGPLWFSPYGGHMLFFTRAPWVHLLLPSKIVMIQRSRFTGDLLKNYEEAGLNKMTMSRFIGIIKKSGLKTVFIKYHWVKKMDFFSRVPFIREFFINQIDCVLEK